MRMTLLVLAAACSLRATEAFAACGPFSSVEEAIEVRAGKDGKSGLSAEAVARREDLVSARKALLAELLPRATAVPVAWRTAETNVRTAVTADRQPEVVTSVRALYEDKPTDAVELLLRRYSDALRAVSDADAALEEANRCLNEQFGIGRGHVNTVVLVGDESKLGFVQEPDGWSGTEVNGAKEGDKGDPKKPEKRHTNTDELIDRLRTECLHGVDIRELGLGSGLANVTRVEGLTPYLDGPDRKPVALTPDRALLVLAAEYEGRYVVPEGGTDKAVKLQCVRLMYLGQARLAGLQLGTYGFGSEGQNRIDLLKGQLSAQVSGRLRDAMYVGIPVRKVMRYQTSRSAEDVLMDGQELELEVTRARTPLERGRTPATEGERRDDTFKTSWSFQAAGMPKLILRMPILTGLVLTDHPETGSKPVWTVGPALGLSYRIPVPLLGQGRYVSPEAFVSVQQRIGTSEEVPDTMWGGGLQVDLSGYLGVGIAYMGDIRFTSPQWVFTIAPVPWISHALGLEKAVGD
jgi:hypothetical protein